MRRGIIALVFMMPGLAGCVALPIVGGVGAAVVGKVGEKAVFPPTAEAVWKQSMDDVQTATYSALRGLGVARVTLEEREGGERAIIATLDARIVTVVFQPAAGGVLTRVRVRAKAEDSLLVDEPLQRTVIDRIHATLPPERRPAVAVSG